MDALESAQTRSPASGKVYFLQAESGPIKIGWTRSLASRMKAIQSHNHEDICLVAVELGTQADEAALHRRFRSCRIRGEWFKPTDELLAYIADSVTALAFMTHMDMIPKEAFSDLYIPQRFRATRC